MLVGNRQLRSGSERLQLLGMSFGMSTGVDALHWLLDTAFHEDDCQARAKNAAEVFNILRKLALQMLKTESSYKCGMKSKRKMCGLGVESAMRVMGMIP